LRLVVIGLRRLEAVPKYVRSDGHMLRRMDSDRSRGTISEEMRIDASTESGLRTPGDGVIDAVVSEGLRTIRNPKGLAIVISTEHGPIDR